MELNDFIKKFAEQFDETAPEEIQASTEFKSLEEWSSLTALSILAMVDDEYDVALKGDDIKNAVTVEDLFNKVASKA